MAWLEPSSGADLSTRSGGAERTAPVVGREGRIQQVEPGFNSKVAKPERFGSHHDGSYLFRDTKSIVGVAVASDAEMVYTALMHQNDESLESPDTDAECLWRARSRSALYTHRCELAF
jgi:hypothetical protein